MDFKANFKCVQAKVVTLILKEQLSRISDISKYRLCSRISCMLMHITRVATHKLVKNECMLYKVPQTSSSVLVLKQVPHSL